MSPIIDSAYFLEMTSKPQHRQGGLGQSGAGAQGNLSEVKRQSWILRGLEFVEQKNRLEICQESPSGLQWELMNVYDKHAWSQGNNYPKDFR